MEDQRESLLASRLLDDLDQLRLEGRNQPLAIHAELTLHLLATILDLVLDLPPFILQVTAAAPPPLEVEEATLRLVMYFQTQKIEQYRLDTGRVPTELEDAGPVFPGMEYIRLTNRDYRILGRTSRVVLSYSSAEPMDLFVGPGAEILDLTVMN